MHIQEHRFPLYFSRLFYYSGKINGLFYIYKIKLSDIEYCIFNFPVHTV